MEEKKFAHQSDALQHAPSFDEMVGLIKKLFTDYLQDVLKSSPEEIEKAWMRYKTLNHLYQDIPQPRAVWVKANAEDRTRWGMHAARYINDNDGLKYTGAAFVEHHSITFYSHILGELKFGKHQLDLVNLFLLDESGTAAGREEDGVSMMYWAFTNIREWDKDSKQVYLHDGSTFPVSSLLEKFKKP